MIVKIGRFLFHYRNGLFPLVYALLLLKSPPLLPDFRIALVIGFLVALSGQMLRAITIGLEYIIRGGRNRQVYAEKLVTGGIFSHCRNPLYVGNLTILLGVGIASNSLLYLCTAIPFFLFAYWAIIAAEEDFLRNKFGQDFDDYCKRANRLLPIFSGITRTLSGMQFNWRRLVSAEYGSTFVWTLAIILVTFKNLYVLGEYQTSPALVTTLWISLGVVVLAYAVSRFLKKTGRLESAAAPPPPPEAAPAQ